ncbi:MAG: DNA translocase FtsK [Deltaproteobacteria bacterium ADurb.BinA179]|jgi:S-DNA-T family DNA segregation ATPase FtsK/SpoIIIE|nr:DNA translocase FtsK 4TM domain-containing protein [Pseudomonadota bacterium]OPZ29343.1 MAG: DNA translocase FtsK [Deltaproteobacteria bacterium ADurb.BinA179]HOD69403.1 DNA translocase FtsK 4TM domain-containing protein [Deltaproteobacteria bacterium]HRR22224.1 DNA translocase FtsK 4TM domain-containing protein [Desulfomonilia bacterium]HOE71262.1 DNA translocase FtsK 4TM domain-containing protein [Deltaproteobacteria bacterium]
MAKKSGDRMSFPFPVLGIFMIFIALYLFLALASYNTADPGFSHSQKADDIKNWMGVIGSYLADGSFIVFGIAAFIIPIFLLEYAVVFMRKKSFTRWTKPLSTLILFFVSLGLLEIVRMNTALLPGTMKAGGILGYIIGKALFTYLSWGSVVLLLMLLCAGVMMGYDIFTPYHAMKDLASTIRENRQLRRKRREMEKPARQKPARKNPEESQDAAHPRVESTTAKKEPQITISGHEDKAVVELPKQATLDFVSNYQRPPLSLLSNPPAKNRVITEKELKANASLIISKLKDFGVEGEILEIKPGPVITMYEFTPAPGIKINKIVSLADDLAMALKASPVRVVAPIPGKNAVGIEIPNRTREMVYLKKILSSREFVMSNAPLTLALGTNIEGMPVVTNLAKMPHLLIAGATGTGKSVGLNTMILSLLYRNDPSELKFIMIDPKRIELSHYEGIPHLLYPVVVNPKEAVPVLKWAVSEMEMRYEWFKDLGVKGIDSYNKKVRKTEKNDPSTTLATLKNQEAKTGLLPKLVIIIDEMADLMMANREVEVYIARLAQMARAAGIYMIVATQRPSVDVITGLIKSNFPSRISFRVSSKIDSRTILDSSGADQLLGLGDMLFLTPGNSHLVRVHGAFVSEEELDKVVEFIRQQGGPEYIEGLDDQIARMAEDDENGFSSSENEYDPVYDQALEFVTGKGSASISLIQRKFRIGYNRAARIIEQMEREGIIGPADTAGKPRKVLVTSYGAEMDE